ncbi:MAG: glutamyl-tRNA reductase [Chloroflexi bacterium]|nr:glutamyl-tRNA reductase [Chloroflexota bacterium]
MKLLVVGLSHQTAPLEVRERAAVPAQRLPEAVAKLGGLLGQAVLLSTCNRTECYTLTDTPDQTATAIGRFLAKLADEPLFFLDQSLYRHQHSKAVRHLFRVAAGLDSQIVGESEVLGQIRAAFSAAVGAGAVRHPLSRAFHCALRAGKRVRRETEIGRHPLSVSGACVELARRTLGDLGQRHALVVGAGEAGTLAARALRSSGIGGLVVTSRTYDHALTLAEELRCQAVPFEELDTALGEAEIVVTAAGTPRYILTPERLVTARNGHRGDPLLLLDIALPRDVDPRMGELPNVVLRDMDDLEAVAETNRALRQQEVQQAEAIVEEETADFLAWWDSLKVVPTIAALHRKALGIQQREMAKAHRHLNNLSPEQQAVVAAMSRALVKKLLHEPITALKHTPDPQHLEMVRSLFGLPQESKQPVTGPRS